MEKICVLLKGGRVLVIKVRWTWVDTLFDYETYDFKSNWMKLMRENDLVINKLVSAKIFEFLFLGTIFGRFFGVITFMVLTTNISERYH